jgi:DNA-binding SARP family transcriptional activator
VQVRVLGDLEVRRGDEVVALGGPKPRTLVGLLVAARGRTIGTERLVDQLWGEEPPPKVLVALQAYVAKLRRELEPARDGRTPPSVLVTRPSGYALVLPEGAVDALRFEDLLTRANRADQSQADGLLEQALALWQGPPFAGLTDAPVLAAEATRLEELRLGALEQLWSARVDAGRSDEAVAALRPLVAEHPARERLWAALALALYRSGRQAEALDELRRVRARLADELGIDPGPELQQLETGLLRQDPALLASPTVQLDSLQVHDPDVGEPLPGRAGVLEAARRVARDAADGRGGVLLVTGEAGIGKTRVAEAIAAVAEGAGLRPAWGTWEAEGCPSLWAWTRALHGLDPGGEALRFGADADTASATIRLAERVVSGLSRQGGTCLVLDDVQWADADSLRLLGRVAGLLASAPVLLVVLCREPVPDDPELLGALAALARAGAQRFELVGLDADDVRALVTRHSQVDVDPVVAARLAERTDGNPFYVHELVRLLVEAGALSRPDDPAWDSIPGSVRDTVRHRLAELSPVVAQALALAAVAGRSVDLDVLESSWDGAAATLDEALDGALAAGLLDDDGAGRLRFAHALVRDAVYTDLPPLTRRRLHARVAAALERCRVGRLDEVAAALAEHYRSAGPAHARSAWIHGARAARSSAEAGAHAEAARLLGRAAEAQAADPLAEPTERESVRVAWGAALTRSGRILEAWQPLRDAAESALERGDPVAAARALLVVTKDVLWSWRREHAADEAAVELWLRVLDELPAGENGLRARCFAALSVEVMHDPPGGRCGRWADEALALARVDGDPATRVDVLQVVLNALRRPDLLPRRVPAADELVALCVAQGDERALAVALCKRALNHSSYARPDAALADLRRALDLAERHRLAPVLMIGQFGLAVLRQARGDWAGCEQALVAAEAAQATVSMAGAGLGDVVRATALLPQGRLAEAEPALRSAGRTHPGLRDLHALSLLAGGRMDEVRAMLGPWSEQPPLIWDYLWVSSAVARALVWAQLGDSDALTDMRRQLEPFADRVADGAMAACFLGAVRHALAALALAAGDRATACARAREARDLHARLGWAPWERLSAELLARAEQSAP